MEEDDEKEKDDYFDIQSEDYSDSNNQANSVPVLIKFKKDDIVTEEKLEETKVPARNYVKYSKIFECPDCLQKFHGEKKMLKHVSHSHGKHLPISPDSDLRRCPFCDEIFNKDSARLAVHLKCFHQDERDDPAYQSTMETAVVTARYICNLCGKDFKKQRSLENHTARDHNVGIDNLPCHTCGKLFQRQLLLDVHIKNVHEDHNLLCGDCGRLFKNKQYLRNHIERIHTSHLDVFCPECGNKFRYKTDLKKHIRRVHSIREKKCEICDKKFTYNSSLIKHVQSVHEKLKPFHCEVCEFRSARIDNLNLHRRKSHNKDKITKRNLISLVESGEHPFSILH